VSRKESETRTHIRDVAAQMIDECGSDALRIVDVAGRANVGVPTIYYHFDSKTQLIAEAQVSNYLLMLTPIHQIISRVELALGAKDESAFWAAIGDDIVVSWKSGQPDDRWRVIKLLLDVWSDPKARDAFCDGLDAQFDRWIQIIDEAKELGWMAEEVDGHALVASLWSATVGQAILSNSSRLQLSPESIRDFFLHAIGVGNRIDQR
jgi:AcrR family transcriptional regulator